MNGDVTKTRPWRKYNETAPYPAHRPWMPARSVRMLTQLSTTIIPAFLAIVLENGQTAFAQTKSVTAPAAPAKAAFNIQPQPLSQALAALSSQTGLQLFFPEVLTRGIQSPGATGMLLPLDALRRILAGTGLTYTLKNANTITLEKIPAASGASGASPEGYSLDALRVVARMNMATTEGTGSYTSPEVTVAGKIPLPVREIPNSVSVITRQRIQDQNLNSVEDVLRQVTGVTAVPYGDGTSYFTARGYQLDAQYDGMPVTSGIQYLTQFDMSIYDRVEVLRGPAGLLQGNGGPAGTANFVRRMPLDHFAFSTDSQAGSWQYLRQSFDISAPLNKSRTARGRVIVTGQDRHFFYNDAKEWHGTAYTAFQFDLTPQTTLSLSGVYQKQRLSPFDYGQSLYNNGSFLNASRSAFFGSDWSYNEYETAEAYANLTHRFGSGFISNTSFLYRNMNSPGRYAYMYGGVDPATNTASYALQSGKVAEEWLNIDSNLSGNFSLFGRTSTFLVGANYSYRTEHQLSSYLDAGVYDIYTAHSSVPDIAAPYTYGQDTRTQQGGLYAQTRLKLLDPLTLILGGRISYYTNETRSLIPVPGNWASDPSTNGKLTPYIGIVYDLNKIYSLYASYTDIFTPQAYTTVAGGGIQPRVGSQYEVGIKAAYFNGRLNASFAAFNINDNHRAVSDPTNPLYYTDAGKARSRGFEAEISGEILPRWNMTAGYTYLDTKYLSDPASAGLTIDPEEPKHTFKLWNKYTFDEGRFYGLSFGAGVRAVSRTQRGTIGSVVDSSAQGGYAVFDAQIGYKFNDNIEGSFTIRNLFNKSYYARLPTNYFGIYGEPRSFLVSLRTRW